MDHDENAVEPGRGSMGSYSIQRTTHVVPKLVLMRSVWKSNLSFISSEGQTCSQDRQSFNRFVATPYLRPDLPDMEPMVLLLDRATWPAPTSSSGDRLVLATVVFAVLLAQLLLYPGVDILVRHFGADTRLNASMWFLAAEFAAFVAFAGLWGAASDATGTRAPFVTAGALGGALGYGTLAVLPALTSLSFTAVLFIRVLQGAATIGAFSLALTMLMDLEGGHGRNMGAAGIAIGLGTALGALLGGQLYEAGTVVPLYAAGILLIGVALLTGILTDRAPSRNRRSVVQIITGLGETPTLLVPYVFGFIDRLTAGFFALVGTLYFRTVFDLTPGATGVMLALFFAPFALLQYPMGILSDRIGRTIPVVGGSAFYGLGVMAVGYAPSVELAGVAMVGVGILGAMVAPATMALVTDFAPKAERGIAMAGFNVFGSVGFLTGIVVGGTLANTHGYGAAFTLTGGLELILAILALPVFLRIGVDDRLTLRE
jgi:MFS family permease